MTDSNRARFSICLAILGSLFMASLTHIAMADVGTVAMVVENDVLSDTDNNYTNGLAFAYLTAEGQVPDLFEDSYQWIADWTKIHAVQAGATLGHSMFTPDDITATTPLPDQHPYAGWLYLSLSVVAKNKDKTILDVASLDLGIVGPSAGAEYVQREFHQIIDSRDPEGWQFQLHDEPGVNFWFQRTERHWAHEETFLGLDTDLISTAGFGLGNIMTQVNASLFVRLGPRLDQGFIPPRVNPSLAGSMYIEQQPGFNWYIFAGAGGRVVAHSIFLDGNTWADSAHVDRVPLVGELEAGFALKYEHWQISYAYVMRSEEFETQGQPHEFASVTLSSQW